MPDLSTYIPLNCCDGHFLHPTKIKIWSTYNNIFRKPQYRKGQKPFFNLHVSYVYLSLAEIQEIQARHWHPKLDMKRPTVERVR